MATLTKSAGSGSSVARDGKSSWSNAGYVTTADSSYASVSISKSSYSSWLYASNFSFGIPDDSAVTGIVATIKKYGNSASSVKDSVVQLCNGSGTLIGSNQAVSTAWPSSNGNTTYGSSTSLWGVSSLKGSDVNATGFGVKISASNSASSSSNYAYVDYVSLAITYTPIYTGICSDGIGFGEGLSSVGNFTNVLTEGLRSGDPIIGGMSYINAAADAGLLSDAVAHAWLKQLADASKLSDTASVELLMGGFAKKIQFGADMPGYGLVKFPIRIDRNDADSVIILDGSSDKG